MSQTLEHSLLLSLVTAHVTLVQSSHLVDEHRELYLYRPASMEQIKATFARCKNEKRAALVTYVTAGYPTAEETPDIMLGMQAGGAGNHVFTAYTT
jgi:hypothetical protein